MTSTVIHVKGMTCGHCVDAVQSELMALPHVRDVAVQLTPGGTSAVTLTTDEPIDAAAVRAAVDEAGYELA